MTTVATNQPDLGQSSMSQVVDDLKSTTQAVQGKGWLSGDFGGASPGLRIIASVPDPLSALSGAGFGFITEAVSFLAEPLQQLAGDPRSVSSGAQGFQAAGQAVSSISDSYRESAGSQTSGWSGAAASEYLKTGAELMDGINGLGQASVALAEAAAGAGEAVAKTLQEVTTLVNEATAKIIMIINQALAAAQATFGASIAAAIPQAVQVAVEYGGRILGHMQNLLSSSQNLMTHVNSTAQAVSKVTDKIAQISERCQASTETSGKPTTVAGSVGSPGQPSSVSGVAQTQALPDSGTFQPSLTAAAQASYAGGASPLPHLPSSQAHAPSQVPQAGSAVPGSASAQASYESQSQMPFGAAPFLPPRTAQSQEKDSSDRPGAREQREFEAGSFNEKR
ncbi:hypothetical protein [Saccharopolyspora pogona]|uniref:hypothetical protein n=1 Tax=Saccharopolyspora pogona TaxID=333966 RepID=UPI001688DADF|nr:hypothetical protein [Saccharopolyspora pogona]